MIGQDRGHFFLNFCSCRGQNYLKMIGWKSLSNSCQGKEISVCFVTMVSRFGIVDEEGRDELKELSENENTKKSTEQWKNVFVKWVTERGKKKNLEAYECVDLDKTLSQFYAEVRNESSEDYKPDSLRVMQTALE